ncbi:hypothetical protein [Paraburkholderia bannensis]|uniref:hypothetical protein n=1 Tax=Paraburkholderia bannensis TaxID=765414 RepID=UPI002AB011FC|nr:hypothetical protein [Paraburkholderia bannensis]
MSQLRLSRDRWRCAPSPTTRGSDFDLHVRRVVLIRIYASAFDIRSIWIMPLLLETNRRSTDMGLIGRGTERAWHATNVSYCVFHCLADSSSSFRLPRRSHPVHCRASPAIPKAAFGSGFLSLIYRPVKMPMPTAGNANTYGNRRHGRAWHFSSSFDRSTARRLDRPIFSYQCIWP